jgi:uncharacterized protein (DUF952 family)
VDRLFHIALRDEWEQGRGAGVYRVSTRGRTLEQQGFVHLSFAGQVSGVADAFYRDAPELVVLELDPARLAGEVRVEPVPGTDERFPHLYGPIRPDAVVAVRPLVPGPGGRFAPFEPGPAPPGSGGA